MEETVKKPKSIVLDTNILISSLVKQEGYTQALLSIILAQKSIRVTVPRSIKSEIESHRHEISRKSGLPLSVLKGVIDKMFVNIETFDEKTFVGEIREALKLVSDEADAPFAGLAIKLRPSIILTYNKKHFKEEYLSMRDVRVFKPGELADYLDMVINFDRKVKRRGGILKLISRLYLLKGLAG